MKLSFGWYAKLMFIYLMAGQVLGQEASLVKNIYPLYGSSLSFTEFGNKSIALGNRLIFSANNSTHGEELWISDGTETGTFMIKDTYPGEARFWGNPNSYFLHNNEAYFSAYDQAGKPSLWKSDGTEKNTIKIWDKSHGSLVGIPYISIDTSLYLQRGLEGRLIRKDTRGTGFETIISSALDPTTTGVYKDNVNWIARADNKWLYLTGKRQGNYESALYETQGTKESTRQIAGLQAPGSWLTYSPTVKLSFFFNDNGVNGVELWKSDGTEAGTKMVKDIAPGGFSAGNIGLSGEIFSVNGGVIFPAQHDGGSGMDLWFTDGTEVGTKILYDFRQGASGGVFFNFLTFEGDPKIYFTTTNDEFWCTDGTKDGTYRIVEGVSYGTKSIQKVNGYFYFLKTAVLVVNGINQYDIIRTSEKPNSSTVLGRLTNCMSFPYYRIVGNNLFYAGMDDNNGVELWKFSLCTHSAQINTPNGASFCPGSSVTISAEGTGSNSGYSYRWREGANMLGTNATLAVTKAGTYTVEVTSSGCTVSRSVEIKETTNFPVAISGEDALCAGQNTTLTASAGGGTAPYSYQWEHNLVKVGTNSHTFQASAAGYYTVTVTDNKGCKGTSTGKNLTSKPTPSAAITASGPTEFLTGEKVVLSVPAASGQTYQWFRNNTAISGATNYSYTVMEDGTYHTTVTRNGCTATSAPKIVSILLAVEPTENEGFRLSVSPNPSTDKVKVIFTMPVAARARIFLYDLAGKVKYTHVSATSANVHEAGFNINGLPSGTYLIQAVASETGKHVSAKIIKH